MKGLILLPTLNRTELLKNFLKSYEETKAEVSVLILADEQDYQANKDQYDEIICHLPSQIKFTNTGVAVSMADKTKHVWDEVKKHEWVGLLNDDHYCITPEWDKKAEGLLDGTNFISTNDGSWNFGIRVVGLTAWSLPLLETCGFPIFPRGLKHLYIDDAWKALGESTGCWHETLTINIEHRHAFIGKSPQDDTFKKVNAQSAYEADLKEFQEFMEQDFKNVCQKILDLRSSENLSAKFV